MEIKLVIIFFAQMILFHKMVRHLRETLVIVVVGGIQQFMTLIPLHNVIRFSKRNL